MSLTRLTYVALALIFWGFFTLVFYSLGADDKSLPARLIPAMLIGVPLSAFVVFAIWSRTKTWITSWNKPPYSRQDGGD